MTSRAPAVTANSCLPAPEILGCIHTVRPVSSKNDLPVVDAHQCFYPQAQSNRFSFVGEDLAPFYAHGPELSHYPIQTTLLG